jgi:hypothetical protein
MSNTTTSGRSSRAAVTASGDRGSLADDLDLRARLCEEAHAVANKRVVVDDEHGDGHLASTGITARTR